MKKFNSLFYIGLFIVVVPVILLSLMIILGNKADKKPIEIVKEIEVTKIVKVRDTVYLPAPVEVKKPKQVKLDTVIKKKVNIIDTLIQRKDTI